MSKYRIFSGFLERAADGLYDLVVVQQGKDVKTIKEAVNEKQVSTARNLWVEDRNHIAHLLRGTRIPRSESST